MSQHVPANAIEGHYIPTMGLTLGRQFAVFFNECAWLHVKWTEYVALFGTNERRIDLLNETAGGFFRIAQDALWESVLLHVARLTDPPKSVGKSNLTLRSLPDLVDPQVKPEVERALAVVLQKVEFARDWRKRHLAHADLALALKDSGAAPLSPASRLHVREALEAIVTLLNTVELFYTHSEVSYEFSRPSANAEALLYVIRDGLRRARERKDRVCSGNFDEDDLAPPL